MYGAITNLDILAHPVVTVQCFGWRLFFKALFSGRDNTFLSILRGANIFSHTTAEIPDLLRRSIALELQAKHIYEILAKTFAPARSVSRFFKELSSQEQDHADLLQVCEAVSIRAGWKTNYLSPWQSFLPQLELNMQQAKASSGSIRSLDDALQLVLDIELSEINQVFQAIIAASDSIFVKKTMKFKQATDKHIYYIARMLPKLSPKFMPASKELLAKFFG